jgi:hypothetical protein
MNSLSEFRLLPKLLIGFVPLSLTAQVNITRGTNRVSVEIDGRPYTGFFYSPEVTKPFLHPIRSVTDAIETPSISDGEHPYFSRRWTARSPATAPPRFRHNRFGGQCVDFSNPHRRLNLTHSELDAFSSGFVLQDF